jgi:hypothetical protein
MCLEAGLLYASTPYRPGLTGFFIALGCNIRVVAGDGEEEMGENELCG